MQISRRGVLKAVASLTMLGVLPLSFEQLASAQPVRVRYDARTAEGREMLKTYARAVDIMKRTGAGTPQSWTFQWYTHAVSGSTTKLAELNRIYGSQPNPDRDLANLVWSTCQAHGSGTWEPNFLPWHRALILFFEDTIRRVAGDDAFTLPYWNYTEDASIPPEFRLPNDSTFAALYQANRNPGINDGLPLTQVRGGLPGQLLSLAVMDERQYYAGPQGVPQGFNERLDNELHGFIHVNTGGTENMGSVPFAAQDPIFWIHHCNIDRIWAGWNAEGGRNPTGRNWATQQVHVFADASGRRIEVANGQVTAIEPLGYAYDSLPRRQVAEIVHHRGEFAPRRQPLVSHRIRVGDLGHVLNPIPTPEAVPVLDALGQFVQQGGPQVIGQADHFQVRMLAAPVQAQRVDEHLVVIRGGQHRPAVPPEILPDFSKNDALVGFHAVGHG